MRIRQVSGLQKVAAIWSRLLIRPDRAVGPQMPENDGYEAATRRALARKAFLRKQGRYLSREEAHNRAHPHWV